MYKRLCKSTSCWVLLGVMVMVNLAYRLGSPDFPHHHHSSSHHPSQQGSVTTPGAVVAESIEKTVWLYCSVYIYIFLGQLIKQIIRSCNLFMKILRYCRTIHDSRAKYIGGFQDVVERFYMQTSWGILATYFSIIPQTSTEVNKYKLSNIEKYNII